MCGIAGIVSLSPDQLQQSVMGMLERIRHRGPDGGGVKSLLSQRIWLGHRRLSIIDLSSHADQPMAYANNRYWITYNGEIYNYLELREELISKGHSFRTFSDTEVILAGYAEWGSDCLQHFNGMWAFVIVDTLTQTVFGARDRFGIKPFFYWVSHTGHLAFASEIKAFVGLPGWKPRLNHQIAYDYLNWSMTDHSDETFFQEVKQLQGGHFFEFNLSGKPLRIDSKQWYRPQPKPFDGGFEQACDEWEALFKNAIKLRLRADVDVGSCLSGGLDSSSIVALSSKKLRQMNAAASLKTFSACFPGHIKDESKFIKIMENSSQSVPFHTTPNVEDVFDQLEKVIWHQDEPFASTSIFASWNVFSVTGTEVKVVLDGQGADEILGGYHVFLMAQLAQFFRTLKFNCFFDLSGHLRKQHGYGIAHQIQQVGNFILPTMIAQYMRKMLRVNTVHSPYLDLGVLKAEARDIRDIENIRNSDIATLSLNQLKANLPSLLRYEDRNSMAHSVESRLPFLDYRLVEFTLGLPDTFKVKDGTTKRILRHVMQKELPAEIWNRKDKIGFATPENSWLEMDVFRKHLVDAVEKSKGIVTHDIFSLYEKVISGKVRNNWMLWKVVNFGKWMDQYGVELH